MNLIVFSILLVFVGGEQEHATDIEIHQVEVIEIPWQEGTGSPPWQGNGSPPWQDNASPPQQEYQPPQQSHGPPPEEYWPSPAYGPPQQEYGPPKPVYGPPPPSPVNCSTTESNPGTTTEIESSTTEQPTTTADPSADYENSNTESAKLIQKNDRSERNYYYIYHPDGILQRVVYDSKANTKNSGAGAQLRYENVEPIKGPIYTYDTDTYKFKRLQK